MLATRRTRHRLNHKVMLSIAPVRSAETYRRAHPDGNRWAASKLGIRHSRETQDRVFRMAEQLFTRRETLSASQLFQVLEAIDYGARWETRPGGSTSPTAAAALGVVGYRVLFGKQPALSGYDWPADCELSDVAQSELATLGLRALGYEPIVFDGVDPAAYVWALFEIAERKAARGEALDINDRDALIPRGLAVFPARKRSAQEEPGVVVWRAR